MSERYQVVKGSESGHCCFEATVIDTEKEVLGHPDWVCECFDPPRAHAIADALNAADEAPLSEVEPVFQDRCGKEFDVLSALLYFPAENGDPVLVFPCQTETNADTGRWKMYVMTLAGHQYLIYGRMFKKNLQLLKLEASGEEINNAGHI
jgi:hypothetical protein